MTTHVFIVDENTFKYHLEYMFAGTGAADKNVDFNSSPNSNLHHSTEGGLVSMMADGCRVRKNDLVLFYLVATSKLDGKFFGIFQAVDDGVFLDNNDGSQYLRDELKKSLTFRLRIKPYEVYEEGVTEWSALDEIKNICSPNQMLWSLIYRKLKGNRGNTMITIYESERLISLIRNKNKNRSLNIQGKKLTFDAANRCIQAVDGAAQNYTGRMDAINILPRLIEKYRKGNAHEAHLQMYITQNIGRGTNNSLDSALGIRNDSLEWIGNEVSCGVGMQRIDVAVSVVENETKRILMPIELKSKYAEIDNIAQIKKYIKWIEQYYIPNRQSIIQPVLICKMGKPLPQNIRNGFVEFNSQNDILPLKYIEYQVSNDNLVFNAIAY